MISLSPACNFEAFSLHFHLPLKAAAEKFGVRATAFKKRCRAIGIRHWPYRKVRSLKRSLQELNRCKDQGALNEKQQYQYATFKKQLDKLMSPETYGIDPSGHITQQHFDDDEEDSGDDDGSYTTTQSPRYGASFSECSISPAEGEKTFGDFSQPVHLRSLRKQQSTFLPSAHLNKPLNPPPFMNDLPALRMGHKDAIHPMNPFYNKYPFGGSYDHYLHDPMGLDNKQTNAMKQHMDEPTDDPQSMGSQMPDNQAASSHPEFLPSASADVKYDEVRPLHDSNEEEFNDHTQHIDYSSERFFDDVFLQISPDYGCLV
ncbi:TPA: hypothetical protein N0F65_005272 [Lagenidium giganteum]|uniref:RWP-RK domain-containing protein n=1 Tax=Lagenidium giganteum TaxID=4803 RepID=A0AAV2YZ72_9STRA|nr:TPA: hypothetical protein N0F65_005272 [Lagenidium giganteum]